MWSCQTQTQSITKNLYILIKYNLYSYINFIWELSVILFCIIQIDTKYTQINL